MNRTITTTEELDVLPVGTVILSHHYPNGPEPAETKASFQKRPDGNWYRGARASWVHPDVFLPATILHDPGKQSRPSADDEQVKRAAAVLTDHADMTDRSSQDGCACGYSDPATVEHHQAQILDDHGLLATADHYAAVTEAYQRGHEDGYWNATVTDMSPADAAKFMAPYRATSERLIRPLPDREQIARAIFDVHNRLGRSGYNGLPRETSLDAADAVLALLKGQPQ